MAFWNKNNYVIDLDKKNYKEYILFKWDRFMSGFTHLWWALLYNTFFALGWTWAVKSGQFDGFSWDSIMSSSNIIGLGFGHITLLGIQGILMWIGRKPKIDKNIKSQGNHLIRKRKLGIVFIILGLMPLIVWSIGRLIIIFMCKAYLKANGSYERTENKFIKDLEIKKVDKDTAIETVSQFAEKILKGKD